MLSLLTDVNQYKIDEWKNPYDKQLYWLIMAWNIKKFLVINKIRIDKLKRMTILKNDEKVGDVLVFGEYAVILSLLTSVYRCILVSFQCWNRWW